MKITKTVEQFDVSAFEVGELYYLFLTNDYDDGTRDIVGKGIYLCTNITCTIAQFMIAIPFFKAPLLKQPKTDIVYISSSNHEMVKQAEKLNPQIEYDSKYKEWNVVMSIEEDET